MSIPSNSYKMLIPFRRRFLNSLYQDKVASNVESNLKKKNTCTYSKVNLSDIPRMLFCPDLMLPMFYVQTPFLTVI